MQRKLSEYIDGYLSPEERRRVEHHLEVCSACRSELDSLKGTVELLRALPSVVPARSFALARVPVPATPAPRTLRPAFLSVATAAVALLLVLVMAGDLLHFFGPGPAALPSQTPAPSVRRDMTPPAPGGETGVRPPLDAQSEKATVPPAPAAAPTPLPGAGAMPVVSSAADGPAGVVRWIEVSLGLIVAILAGLTVFARWRVRRAGSRGG